VDRRWNIRFARILLACVGAAIVLYLVGAHHQVEVPGRLWSHV
jgi:uncharacterized membrane protein YeaQ/YmgE (transglycosylase-associated protein family)